MTYGICNLGIVPLRSEPSDKSEMVSQLLFGELFECLEKNKKWCRIRSEYDKYEGWIDSKQFFELDSESFMNLCKSDKVLASDLVEFSIDNNENLMPIPIGSELSGINLLGLQYEGNRITGKKPKQNLIPTAFLYRNAPYLWGGKTPFGIDCSGLVQMVYKLNGYQLFRDASQQVGQGETLSFIEESEPGDLAFFENEEGEIIHVGMIMKNNYILHAHGKVRIDRLDHNGIFNASTKRYSHRLRTIKRIL